MPSSTIAAARAKAPALAARALPILICSIGCIALFAVSAYAQGTGTPSEKPADQILLSQRNWIIVKGVVLLGATIIAWKSLGAAAGDHDGLSKMAKSFVAVIIGLFAVSIINLFQSWG